MLLLHSKAHSQEFDSVFVEYFHTDLMTESLEYAYVKLGFLCSITNFLLIVFIYLTQYLEYVHTKYDKSQLLLFMFMQNECCFI